MFFNRTIKVVYLLDSIDFFDSNTFKKNIFEKTTNRLFKNVVVQHVPKYLQDVLKKNPTDLCWEANRLTLRYLESDNFRSAVKVTFPLFLKRDEFLGFLIASKKVYMPYVYKKILFYLQINEFQEKGIEINEVIATKSDFLEIRSHLNLEVELEKIIQFDGVSRLFEISKAFLFFFFSPYLIRNALIHGLAFQEPQARSFKVAVQVVQGLKKEDFENRFNVHNSLGDVEIQSQKVIDSSKILYTLGKAFGKKLTSDYLKEQKRLIQKSGASFVDERQLRIPIRFFFKHYLWNGMLLNIFLNFRNILKKNNSFLSMEFSQRIISSYLDHELFCRYFKVRVYFSRDDYDFEHITRTMIQRRHGLLNHGLQHSALQAPYIIPSMAYSFFDTYYITGERFIKLWAPYWENNKSCIVVGNRTDKFLLTALKDEARKEKFIQKYGRRKTILVLISPPNEVISPPMLLKARYEGIARLSEIAEDVNVILRPRAEAAIETWQDLFPELRRPLAKGSISFEWGDFTTHELMAFSDVLVAEDSSSTILEGIYFDHLFITSINARYPEIAVTKDLVCSNVSELIHLLETQWLTGQESLERRVAVEELKKGYTLPPLEDCWSKIAEHIDFCNHN